MNGKHGVIFKIEMGRGWFSRGLGILRERMDTDPVDEKWRDGREVRR